MPQRIWTKRQPRIWTERQRFPLQEGFPKNLPSDEMENSAKEQNLRTDDD
jgi:hypothetical protein